MKISRYSILEAVHRTYPRAQVIGICEMYHPYSADGWVDIGYIADLPKLTKAVKSFVDVGSTMVNLYIVDQVGVIKMADFSLKELSR
jgi:hypothetical protein